MSKVALFWLRKGCRTPKMVGTATAAGSVGSIDAYARMAREGKGRFFVVDCAHAREGREIIKAWRNGDKGRVGGITTVVEGPDRIVALGTHAALAIGGASFKAAVWDDRIRSQGRVTVEQSRALNSTTLDEYSLETAFGQGLGVKR